MSCSDLYNSGLEFGLECECRSYPWTKNAFSATAEPVVVHVVIMHV